MIPAVTSRCIRSANVSMSASAAITTPTRTISGNIVRANSAI